jgi:hypothetical protein
MYYEIVKQGSGGHFSMFVVADSPTDALTGIFGKVVAVRCLGPGRVPDKTAKRANGYSEAEWQEVRYKRPRRGKDAVR